MFFYNGVYRFEHTTNFERIRKFDDELDIGLVKLFFEGIKQDCKTVLTNKDSVADFEKYRLDFRNEARFGDVKFLESNNFESAIEDIKKIFFRFDYKKRERSNKDSARNIFKKIILAAHKDRIEIPDLVGIYEETIKFDVVVDKKAIKYFEFTEYSEKTVKKRIYSLKYWAYNSLLLKEKGYDTAFVINPDNLSDANHELIRNILSRNAEVYNLDDAIQKI
jgi:hypothetical protein